ncbi:MAG: hypothetical protein HY718_11730 [Planctomycetes bacterium]|nr:hypothetical protein [Planctomycetota bacterium]
MGRSLDELRRDQEAILAAYRSERTAAQTVQPSSAAAVVHHGAGYGRVVEVVESDEDYGPHLLVMRQAWSGTPPVPTDAGPAALRCYPLPNRAVSDFNLDELVRFNVVPGAILVEPLPVG